LNGETRNLETGQAVLADFVDNRNHNSSSNHRPNRLPSRVATGAIAARDVAAGGGMDNKMNYF
jgi:hypothetical protein